MNRLYMIVGNDSRILKRLDIVRLIAIINNAYLVENVETEEREWIMNYNLYDISGNHIYNKIYDDLIPDKYRN